MLSRMAAEFSAAYSSSSSSSFSEILNFLSSCAVADLRMSISRRSCLTSLGSSSLYGAGSGFACLPRSAALLRSRPPAMRTSSSVAFRALESFSRSACSFTFFRFCASISRFRSLSLASVWGVSLVFASSARFCTSAILSRSRPAFWRRVSSFRFSAMRLCSSMGSRSTTCWPPTRGLIVSRPSSSCFMRLISRLNHSARWRLASSSFSRSMRTGSGGLWAAGRFAWTSPCSRTCACRTSPSISTRRRPACSWLARTASPSFAMRHADGALGGLLA
mmetsp:Transcript_48590/g.105880  ORF Transcript_48590/g.105880 Transcript_48590/m.105880 type:complete len:276 (+) Transcript_48590:363-1190(+)